MSNERKPQLRLVRLEQKPKEVPKKPINQVESHNFWNTCPRKLGLMPTTPCALGKCRKNPKGTIVEEAVCPWAIDAEKHHYCFWRYVQANSTPDGKMEPLLQNEIADFFGCSSTKIHFILKEAFKHLLESEYLEILGDFYGPAGESKNFDGSAIDSFLDSAGSYSGD